jgi:hypothetical protein
MKYAWIHHPLTGWVKAQNEYLLCFDHRRHQCAATRSVKELRKLGYFAHLLKQGGDGVVATDAHFDVVRGLLDWKEESGRSSFYIVLMHRQGLIDIEDLDKKDRSQGMYLASLQKAYLVRSARLGRDVRNPLYGKKLTKGTMAQFTKAVTGKR